jgi:hypothetical protein
MQDGVSPITDFTPDLYKAFENPWGHSIGDGEGNRRSKEVEVHNYSASRALESAYYDAKLQLLLAKQDEIQAQIASLLPSTPRPNYTQTWELGISDGTQGGAEWLPRN